MMIEILLLSFIQGVTEFLPISSSAHLIFISNFFDSGNETLTLDISLHIGSLLAIIYYFKKDILDLIKNKNLLFFLILASLPTLVFGYILVTFNLIENLRNIKIIGATTIIFGIILYISDLKSENKNFDKNLDLKSILFIGFFQIFSLIPGVSRSGITITAARFLNFKRTDSAKISFWLSIPTLCAVSLYNIQKIITTNNHIFTLVNFVGILFSFIFSYVTIKYFIKYLKKFSLFFFVIYRLIIGLIVLVYAYN